VEIIEAIRVETGMIVTGYDYDEHERSPYDLGLDRMVALDGAGEFMGKDELRTIAAAPEPLQDDQAPGRHAARVRRRTDQGRRGRRRCSPARRSAPILGPLGLAIIRTDVAVDGTQVDVAMPDGSTQAGTIDVLALYDPKKTRPRA
jgi:glycine cleavage system aminomethyltransferase T